MPASHSLLGLEPTLSSKRRWTFWITRNTTARWHAAFPPTATAMPPAASWRGLHVILKLRLLYITHVDWGHVRQRPHHLAAALAAHVDVTVVFPISRHRSRVVSNAYDEIRLAPIV